MSLLSYNFLVDINLPKYFSFFNHPSFFHVRNLNKNFTDEEIWNYALKKGHIILTKDRDFFVKSFISKEKPKIVHFPLHNFTLSDLHGYFFDNWEKIVSMLDKGTLIEAKKDSVRVIF